MFPDGFSARPSSIIAAVFQPASEYPHGHHEAAVRRRHHAGGPASPGSNARARPSMRRASTRCSTMAARECAVSGATIERIAGRMGFGDCVRATLSPSARGKPGILIMGHLDTVHPVGTLAKLPWRRDGERCYGPGIFDMKGGNFLALEAVRMLQRIGACARAARDVAVHQRRGGRQPQHARPDRGGGGAPQIRAGAGARPRRRRRGHRPLRHRALQSQGHRPAEPCRRAAEGRPLRDPHHGGHDPADRRHDHAMPARSASAWCTAGSG